MGTYLFHNLTPQTVVVFIGCGLGLSQNTLLGQHCVSTIIDGYLSSDVFFFLFQSEPEDILRVLLNQTMGDLRDAKDQCVEPEAEPLTASSCDDSIIELF